METLSAHYARLLGIDDSWGVKTIVPPWAGKHSRFALLFEAFAIEVLQACRTVNAAAALALQQVESVSAAAATLRGHQA